MTSPDAHKEGDRPQPQSAAVFPFFLTIGISVGVAVGIAMNNLTLGICLGLALGAGIDAIMYLRLHRKKRG